MQTQRTAKKLITRQFKFSTKQVATNLAGKKFLIVLAVTFSICVLLSPIISYSLITSSFGSLIDTNIADLERTPVAIVFGATTDSNEPSPILRRRLDTAIELYKEKKVSKIIVSGDSREIEFNEPVTMYNYLLTQEIPDADIVMDGGSNRTYDTCYRAKKVYGVNEAILVTQRFHLYRALYLCSAQNIAVQGFSAEADGLDTMGLRIREVFAIVLAVWQVNISPPSNVAINK
jgi:vancomycin permeability regulator SanA